MGYIGQTIAPLQTQIAPNIISASNLQDNIISSAKIINSTIAAVDISDSAVTTAKIQNGAINNDKLDSSAVTSTKILDSAVTTAKIADNAVLTSKLQSNIVLKGAATVVSGILETANIIASNVTANITIDKFSSSVLFYTQNSTSNQAVTVNITNLASVPIGNVSSFVVMLKNNAEFRAYINDTQIEGNPGNTASWLSGLPTEGTANLDVYSFSVIKSGGSEYTILANKSNFN